MKGFDQMHMFLLVGLLVVALLCPHQEDAAWDRQPIFFSAGEKPRYT